LQGCEAGESHTELESLQHENEALKAQMARLSSQLLEVRHELLKENSVFFFLNLDLISGMKYVYLLTENSLAKVGVLRDLFR